MINEVKIRIMETLPQRDDETKDVGYAQSRFRYMNQMNSIAILDVSILK